MTLRIERQDSGAEVVLELHGWFSLAEVAEFERAAGAEGPPLRIDLEHLVGADADGLRALLKRGERGARISGASPYIVLLLRRTAGGASSGNE